jgi:RHS repeat-associated protein
VTLARETLHLMDDKQRIALVETRTQGSDPAPAQLIRYQLGNHLGSASLELDDQAQIISYEEFYPYGSTSYQAVRSQTETPKRYRYTGKERDEETGLYYHGARYYAVWVGRWVSCDPTGFADGTNLYRYSRDNPIKLHDPSGTHGTQPRLSANDPRIKAYEQRLNQVRGRLVPVHPGNPPIQSFRAKGAGTGKGAHFGPAPTLPDPWKKEGTGSPAGSQSPHGTQSQPMGTSDISQPGNADASRSGSAVDASGYQEAGANRTSGVGGTGKDKSAMSTPLTELDYATLLASVLSPLGSEQSKEGVSGGIPGGKGPKWMASPVGQIAYIAINLFFTFFSGVVESGLRKAWTAAKPFARAAASEVVEDALRSTISQTVYVDTTVIDAIRRGTPGVESQLLAARGRGVEFVIPRPVYTEALRGKHGEAAREIIERLGLSIDEGLGMASRIPSYEQAVREGIRFEGLFSATARETGDLVIGAHVKAANAALWTLDERSITPLKQLGVRFWSP